MKRRLVDELQIRSKAITKIVKLHGNKCLDYDLKEWHTLIKAEINIIEKRKHNKFLQKFERLIDDNINELELDICPDCNLYLKESGICPRCKIGKVA